MNSITNKLFTVLLACAALLIPVAASATFIVVDPLEWDYGNVELGDSVSKTFIVENTGPNPLLVDEISIRDDDTGFFEITSVTRIEIGDEPYPYFFELPVDHHMVIEVTFTPNTEGMAAADLFFSNDSFYYYNLYIPLLGEGIDNEPTPGDLMADAIAFLNYSVANEAIYGVGSGRSAAAHLSVFAGMLDKADDLIAEGDFKSACRQLSKAADSCDGASRPPDLIGGDNAAELHWMILEVMTALGC